MWGLLLLHARDNVSHDAEAGRFFSCTSILCGVECPKFPFLMIVLDATAVKPWSRRAWRAVWQVVVVLLFVPMGLFLGWKALEPSTESLLNQASGGADSEALLELVERAASQDDSDYLLGHLLRQDGLALRALIALATTHESALQYLIGVARTQPDILTGVADVRVNHPFALSLLEHINTEGVRKLQNVSALGMNECYILGVAYEYGTHVAQSWSAAADYYGQAYGKGYESARVDYARAAYQAALVSQNPEEAAVLFRRAAECGHAAAQCAYGVCCAEGKGIELDLTQAVRWYRLSAEQGYCDALFNLGWCYLYGEGVEPDAAQSAHYFRGAAEQGDDLAQYYLGCAYERGHGVPRDFNQALYWYRLSAELGNAVAECAVGYCYAGGLGVPHDASEAARWFGRSARHGHHEAETALEQLQQNSPESGSSSSSFASESTILPVCL